MSSRMILTMLLTGAKNGWWNQATKCKTMRISRGHNSTHAYLLNNIPLSSVESYIPWAWYHERYLTWNMHVDYKTNNANRRLGYLRWNFHFLPPAAKLTLRKSLISHLQAYSEVWVCLRCLGPGKIPLIQSLKPFRIIPLVSSYQSTAVMPVSIE